MSVLEIPAVLNRIASAEAEGIGLLDDPSLLRDVELCRSWGYPLAFDQGRVRLARDPDAIVPVWIESETRGIAWGKTRVRGFFEIGSTNDEALSCARAGAAEGTLIYAVRQTAGKGRLGRKWISPAHSGLYFTLILRPHQPLSQWPILTHVASVALFESLRDLGKEGIIPNELAIDLKWPNDILLSGKKTAGILLETALGGAEAAVVGVGVNIAPESVPVSLSDQATAVGLEAGVPIPRRWLLVRFLKHFQNGYRRFSAGRFAEILDDWKRRSTMWNGVEITVTEGDRIRAAVTCGLSATGALKIRTADGNEETVLAGDVSVRRQ